MEAIAAVAAWVVVPELQVVEVLSNKWEEVVDPVVAMKVMEGQLVRSRNQICEEMQSYAVA